MKTIFISYRDWEKGTAYKESGDRHPDAIVLPDGSTAKLKVIKTELEYTFVDEERTITMYYRVRGAPPYASAGSRRKVTEYVTPQGCKFLHKNHCKNCGKLVGYSEDHRRDFLCVSCLAEGARCDNDTSA